MANINQLKPPEPDSQSIPDVDNGQISQVVQNTIINARQAMSVKGNMNISCKNKQYFN